MFCNKFSTYCRWNISGGASARRFSVVTPKPIKANVFIFFSQRCVIAERFNTCIFFLSFSKYQCKIIEIPIRPSSNCSMIMTFPWCYIFITGLLLFETSTGEWNTRDYLKREHSLIQPYQATGMTIPYWDFGGVTIVTNNYIRLTPDAQSTQGSLWNSVPCYVRNWELQVQFKVHGKGKELFGDGLAIWYAKDRMEGGPVFGNKDFFHGLAIILDTYSNHNGPHNHQHPYISAMINNGSLHYDHDRDGTHTQLEGCEAKFRNFDHDTHIAIRYEKDTLTVSTDLSNKAAWKECFSVPGIKLPTGYYFGVTATTGDLSDNHDIISVRLYELDLPDDVKDEEDRSQILPSAMHFESPREHVEDPKPSALNGVKTFFLMLIAAVVLIAVLVLGIMYYQKHQENSRKRFY